MRYNLELSNGDRVGFIRADRIETESGPGWTVQYFYLGNELIFSVWHNRLKVIPQDQPEVEVPEQHDADRVRFPL